MFKKALANIDPFCLVVKEENLAIKISRRKKQVYITDLGWCSIYGAKKEILKVAHPKLASIIEQRFKISLSDYGVFVKL